MLSFNRLLTRSLALVFVLAASTEVVADSLDLDPWVPKPWKSEEIRRLVHGDDPLPSASRLPSFSNIQTVAQAELPSMQGAEQYKSWLLQDLLRVASERSLPKGLESILQKAIKKVTSSKSLTYSVVANLQSKLTQDILIWNRRFYRREEARREGRWLQMRIETTLSPYLLPTFQETRATRDELLKAEQDSHRRQEEVVRGLISALARIHSSWRYPVPKVSKHLERIQDMKVMNIDLIIEEAREYARGLQSVQNDGKNSAGALFRHADQEIREATNALVASKSQLRLIRRRLTRVRRR
jgi:hypothetical protein